MSENVRRERQLISLLFKCDLKRNYYGIKTFKQTFNALVFVKIIKIKQFCVTMLY